MKTLIYVLAGASISALLGSFVYYYPYKNTSKMIFESTAQDCFDAHNFKTCFMYVQWKQKTSKKLSKNNRVLFSGYELEAIDQEDTGKKIVFSKDDYKIFSIDEKQGYIPHTKVAKEKRHKKVFCELVKTAQFKALPQNYTYKYADGSGNVWTISESKIIYDPVSAIESSSGEYDGGKPYTKDISLETFQMFENLFLKAFSAKNEQQDKREMGTGSLSRGLTATTPTTRFYLMMSAPSKKQIEDFLEQQKP